MKKNLPDFPFRHPWTCKITIAYHRCPGCGYAFESREDYRLREGKPMKELACPRCKHTFTLQGRRQPRRY